MLHTRLLPTRVANTLAVVTILVALLAAAIGTQVVTPAFAANTTYYVDCTAGNDSNNGTSTSTPWRTMARASQQTYGAGDGLLFKRGTTCSGVGLKLLGSGTTASPITIADYGSGNLPILDGNANPASAPGEAAILIRNNQNVVVRNLELTQHNQLPTVNGASNDNLSDTDQVAVLDIRGLQSGIDNIGCGEPCTVRNITLDGLKIHDGQWKGILIEGGLYDLNSGPTYGYVDNVLVQNSEVWNNAHVGVDVTSTYTKQITYHTTNVTIRTSYLHDNGWDGIRMGPVDHGLIDSNECSYNGRTENARLGCWGWDSHDLVMQFNNSHHNMTPADPKSGRDAGGFDCDLGTEDCVMQYNWSHDNLGEGFLLMTWPIGYGFQRGESHNIHMRYNIGERDGKYLGSSIFFFGFTNPGIVYNNTIYYEPDRLAGSTAYQAEGAAIDFSKWGKSGVPTAYIYNNIFIANGTVNPNAVSNLVRDESGCTCTFDNNLYYRVEGGVRMDWGGTIYTTFSAWQASGRDANGVNANPLFTGAFGGGPSAYHLASGSPAIDRARVVTVGLRGMGTRDYFGLAIPQSSAYDIGAAEFAGGGATATPAPPTNTPTRTNTPVPPTATNTPGGPTNTPTNTSVPPTATPTRTNTPVPPTATPGGSVVMHVVTLYTTDSAGTPKDVFNGGDTLYWRVKIVDANNVAVSGASVSSKLTRADGSTFSYTGTGAQTTDASGWAYFSQKSVNSWPSGTTTVEVTDVTKTGATYDPAANVGTPHSFTVN